MIRKRKKVAQYTLDGKHVATYDSISEASATTGTSVTQISWCARGWTMIGGRKTKCARAGDYMWRDADKYIPTHIKPYSHPLNKKTAKYDIFGNLIEIYDSRKSAVEDIGLKQNGLSFDKGHTSGTYQWRSVTSHKKDKIAPVKNIDKLQYDRPIAEYDRITKEKIASYPDVKSVGVEVENEPNVSFATTHFSVFNGSRWGVEHKPVDPNRWVIVQYTLNGDFVGTYPHTISAARAMKVSKQRIFQAINGGDNNRNHHMACGYQWFKRNDFGVELPEKIDPVVLKKRGRKKKK